MSGKIGIIRYSRDELIKCNVYSLKKIPDGDRYALLRKFVTDEKNVNLSDVVKQPAIPAYLKARYGTTSVITKGNFREQNGRHKLYTAKIETVADQINEEIRDLLSKMSDSNKDKLLTIFMQKEIPDECGQTLIDNIYEFAVDLSYLIHLYVELILKLKDKNETLYHQLINKIVSNACQPIPSTDDLRRLRLGNILLVVEVHNKNASVIDASTIHKIATLLVEQVSPKNQESLQILCELLKKINRKDTSLDSVVKILRNISYDHEYDKKYRFKIQEVIELYSEEDD
jgi:hypothetical protein